MPRFTDEDSVKKYMYSWIDPDGVINFDKYGDPDCAWGTEEFILLTDFQDEHRNLVHPDGSLLFKVSLTLYSPVDFSRQPLNIMIENASSDSDLLALADEDLAKVIIKPKHGEKLAGEDVRKQDRLFSSRVEAQVDKEKVQTKQSRRSLSFYHPNGSSINNNM